MENWHAKKWFEGQTKGTVASQNILELPKQINSDGSLNFFSYFVPGIYMYNVPGSAKNYDKELLEVTSKCYKVAKLNIQSRNSLP